jgi:conjugal transfer mating pair stabilization protein TraN
LGLGWGEGKNPQCRGLSIEEIQRIDFSKIDLREIHEDIMKNMKVPAADTIGRSLKSRMQAMTQGFSVPKVPQGGL